MPRYADILRLAAAFGPVLVYFVVLLWRSFGRYMRVVYAGAGIVCRYCTWCKLLITVNWKLEIETQQAGLLLDQFWEAVGRESPRHGGNPAGGLVVVVPVVVA